MKTDYDNLFNDRCKCYRCIHQTIISNSTLFGAQFNSSNNKNKILENGEVIPFDTTNVTNANIILSNNTFTVLKKGIYIINYYININGSSADTTIKISCNGIDCIADNSAQAQINGFAILNLNPNDIISISNNSNQQILLSGADIQAGVIIYSVS